MTAKLKKLTLFGAQMTLKNNSHTHQLVISQFISDRMVSSNDSEQSKMIRCEYPDRNAVSSSVFRNHIYDEAIRIIPIYRLWGRLLSRLDTYLMQVSAS